MFNIRSKRLVSAVTATALAATTLVLTGSFAAQAATTTITYYVPTTQQGDSPYRKVAEAFMKDNPQYKVKLTEVAGEAYANGLQTSLQAGNGPDVFRTEPGQGNTMSLLPLARKGFLLPLNGTNANKVNPASVKSTMNLGTKVYGVAMGLTAGAIVANETLLKADGLSWPKTYNELLTACKTARAKGKSFFALAGAMAPNTGLMAMSILGNAVYGSDPSWSVKRTEKKTTFASSSGWRQAMNMITEMKAKQCFQDGAEGADFSSGIDANFFAHRAYAVFVPGSISFVFKNFVPPTKGEDIVTEAFPGVTEAKTYIPVSVNYATSVNAKTKNKAAALALVNYIASAKGQAIILKATGELPTTSNISAANVPDAQAYRNVLKYLKAKKTYAFPSQGFSKGAVYDNLGKGIQGILTGQVSGFQVLQTMDAAW